MTVERLEGTVLGAQGEEGVYFAWPGTHGAPAGAYRTVQDPMLAGSRKVHLWAGGYITGIRIVAGGRFRDFESADLAKALRLQEKLAKGGKGRRSALARMTDVPAGWAKAAAESVAPGDDAPARRRRRGLER